MQISVKQPKVVKITQDGAGIGLRTTDINMGFCTYGVESCIIYTFFGPEQFCMIHDTGQIALESIYKLIDRLEPIDCIYTAVNKSFKYDKRWVAQMEEHEKRFYLIRSRIAGDIKIANLHCNDGGVIVFGNGQQCVYGPPLEYYADHSDHAPDIVTRHAINVVNNTISPANSQSIPVDIQFDDNSFCENPKILFSEQEIVDEIDKEGLLIMDDMGDFPRALSWLIARKVLSDEGGNLTKYLR